LWTERYRPKNLSGIRGQDAAVSALRQWAKSWERGSPGKKAVILYGPAGTGKTTAALALAGEMGWDVMEVNASDKRTQATLEDVIKSSRIRYNLLTGPGLRLYVLDEIDGLSGTDDRGGVRAISQMISETANPVVLTCNDIYSPRLRYLKRKARAIAFSKPRKSAVQGVLAEICRKEGVKPDLLALNLIAERSEGDLRSAINDLEAISVRGEISREDVRIPGKRRSDSHVYRLLDLIFAGDPSASDLERDLDIRPEDLVELVAENAHLSFRGRRERARAYDLISLSDVCLGRVRKRMHWRFWGYAVDLMTKGLVSLAANRYPVYRDRPRYVYPSAYRRYGATMSSLRKSYEEGTVSGLADVAREIGDRCHMSTERTLRHFIPYLNLIQQSDPDAAGGILRWAGVSEEELCQLPYGPE